MFNLHNLLCFTLVLTQWAYTQTIEVTFDFASENAHNYYNMSVQLIPILILDCNKSLDSVNIIIEKTKASTELYFQNFLYCYSREALLDGLNLIEHHTKSITLTIKTLEPDFITHLLQSSFINTVDAIHFDFSTTIDSKIPQKSLQALHKFFERLPGLNDSLLSLSITMPHYYGNIRKLYSTCTLRKFYYICDSSRDTIKPINTLILLFSIITQFSHIR